MREVFFCEQVETSVAKLIKDKYPYGTVAVFGASAEFLEMLKAQNNPYVEGPTSELAKQIRYIVAFGNDRQIAAAKSLANARILILCPNKLSATTISNYALIGNQICKVGYPNYIYLHNDLIDLYCNDLLQAMILVHISALDIMAAEVCVSKEIEDIFKQSYTFIINDRSNNCNIEKGMQIIAKMWDYKASSAIMYAEFIALTEGREHSSAGVIFLIYVLTQFTKCKISGILYGADRVRIRQLFCFPKGHKGYLGEQQPFKPSYHVLERFLPCDEIMWRIKAQCLGDAVNLQEVRYNCKQTIDNLMIAMELVPTNGALTYFASCGFLEGVFNENSS
ncbi:MAG: hypothetical protein R3Y23_01435 [Bacillota bacterium]